MRRWTLILLPAVLLLAGGIGLVAWFAHAPARYFYTDAHSIRVPTGEANPRDVLWQPPCPLDDALAQGGPADLYEPRLSWDGLTLFFVRGRAGQNADIFISRRSPAGWDAPVPLDAVNSDADDLGPEPSHDARRLLFYSNRAGGQGGYDIWASECLDGAWQPPVNLGPAVNSGYNDYGPALTPDGGRLYFASNRPQPSDTRQPDPAAWPATVREDLFARPYDIYESVFTPAGFAEAWPVAVLSTPHNEGAPAFSPAGDFLYFASDRPGGAGGFDLYRARRIGDAFQPPENLGPPVNTLANELDPGLSSLGFTLFFSSDRGLPAEPGEAALAAHEQAGPAASVARYRLYYTTAREVFVETELARREFDWAALWRALWPNLLWLLLALLALLLLLGLWRDMQRRRLSLLVRCLLASLMLHLLALMLSSLWQVGAAVASLARGDGAILVALSPAADSDELAAQIHGALAVPDLPSAETPDLMPRQPVVPQPIEFSSARLAADAPAIESPAASDAPLTREATPAPPALRRVELAAVLAPLGDVHMRTPREAEAHAAADETAPLPAGAASPPAARAALAGFAAHAPAAPAPADISREITIVDPARPVQPPVHEAAPPVAAPRPRLAVVRDVSAADPISFSLRVPTEESFASEPKPAEPPRSIAAAAPAVPRAALSGLRAATLIPVPDRPAPAVTPSDPASAALIAPSPEAAPREARMAPPSLPTAGVLPHAPPEPRPLALGLPQAPAERPRLDEAPAPEPAALALAVRAEIPRPAAAVETPGSWSAAASLAADPPKLAAHDAPTKLRLDTPRDRPAALALPAAPVRLAALDRVGPPLRLPPAAERHPLTDAYAQRDPQLRRERIEQLGGNQRTESAVERALSWLARHQSPDGHWDGRGFDASCGGCEGSSTADMDATLTGLALLAFLAANHTHFDPGPHQDNARRAIDWLVCGQQPDGDLRRGDTMYAQGIATMALCEAYAMTGDETLAEPARRAVGFILHAQHPRTGGWRHQPGEEGDTSVLGWQVMALRSAALAGIHTPPSALAGAKRFLLSVEDRARPGHYAYLPGEAANPTMTAEALHAQQILGQPADDPRTRVAVERLLANLPSWSDGPATYYWFHATQALFHLQGDAWPRWNRALRRELLNNQVRGGPADGSWPAAGDGAVGGRVYQTALCALMLESYYRHLPSQARDYVGPGVGALEGLARSAETREPLGGVTIRLDVPHGEPLVATTDADGRYLLVVPQTPEHFALSASHSGYVPGSRNVSAEELRGRVMRVDFDLVPVNIDVVALESEPEVHHLGNDRFEGRINSQFQRASEGDLYVGRFALSEAQAACRAAALTLLAKGVQCPHELRINGRLLDSRLDHSPEDGSFGELRFEIPMEALRAGENEISIRAVACRGDLDDFEFVNLLIRLQRPAP